MQLRHLFYSIILLNCIGHLNAQDIHFSQYYESPTLFNAASSGAGNNDFRLAVNYRNQWQNIMAPYKTIGLAFDSRINKRNKRKDNRADNYFGYGLNMFNDKAGLSNLTTNQLEGNLAYHIYLNTKHSLSAGVKIGFYQRIINTSNLKWDAQFNGKTYDSSLPNQENNVFQSFMRFDIGAGLLYRYHNRSTGDRFETGISMTHLTQPQNSFYASGIPLENKYQMHANYSRKIASSVFLRPNVLYIQQGKQSEINCGLNVRLETNTDISSGVKNQKGIYTSAVQFGLHHRFKDAFIAVAGFEFNKNIYLGISYDVNTSKLIRASRLRGGYELSLVITQQKNSKLRTKY